MQIVEKLLSEIKPYAKNPRKNDKAVDKVAASIREFGFKVPIVIDRDGTIAAGHTRYKAAQQLGMDRVPCIIADDLTPEQVKAFRLADNKVGEFAEWVPELLEDELGGIFDIDMEEFGFDLEEEQTIEAADDNYDFKETVGHRAKPGDLFQLGDHRLMCGDSTVVTDLDELMGGGLREDGLHRSALRCGNRRQEQSPKCRPEGWTADGEHHGRHDEHPRAVRDAEGRLHESPAPLRGGLLVLRNISAGR